MKTQQLKSNGTRRFVVVLEPGEEAVECLTAFAEQAEVTAAEFTGIGAFSDVVLGFFDLTEMDYRRIPIKDQVEVVSLIGNITSHEGKPKLHPHVVIATRDGFARGGHLLSGHVEPTLEIIVTDTPAYLRRRVDPRTGLPLLALSGEEGEE
jgi:uncharacterized protein